MNNLMAREIAPGYTVRCNHSNEPFDGENDLALDGVRTRYSYLHRAWLASGWTRTHEAASPGAAIQKARQDVRP